MNGPDQVSNPNKVDPVSLLDLLEKSYKEVLDATKHQDDKVGRFLTAFAFFAGGAIALLNQDFIKNTSYQIEPFSKLKLPALLLGFFLVLLGFTVLALLMSVGTPLKLPGFVMSSSTSTPSSVSPIYFLAISKVTNEEWKAQLEGMSDDERATWLNESLISETHNLATRTYQKYDRYQEARAIFEFAVVMFTLAIATAIPAFAVGVHETVLKWDFPVRLFVGMTFGLLVGIIGYDRYRGDSSVRILQPDASKLARQRAELGLVVSAVVWTGLSVTISPSGFLTRVLAVVVSFLPWVIGILSMRSLRSKSKPDPWQKAYCKQAKLAAISFAVLLVSSGLLAFAGRMNTVSWHLALSLFPILALELDQMSRATISWRSLKRDVRSRMPEDSPQGI
jgi:hypothetical protein